MIRRVGQIIKLITASSILTIGINWDSLTPRATLLIYRRWAEFSIFHFWEMKSVQKELARPILLQARVCGCVLDGPHSMNPSWRVAYALLAFILVLPIVSLRRFVFFLFLWWVAPVTFCEIQWCEPRSHYTPSQSHICRSVGEGHHEAAHGGWEQVTLQGRKDGRLWTWSA